MEDEKPGGSDLSAHERRLALIALIVALVVLLGTGAVLDRVTTKKALTPVAVIPAVPFPRTVTDDFATRPGPGLGRAPTGRAVDCRARSLGNGRRERAGDRAGPDRVERCPGAGGSGRRHGRGHRADDHQGDGPRVSLSRPLGLLDAHGRSRVRNLEPHEDQVGRPCRYGQCGSGADRAGHPCARRHGRSRLRGVRQRRLGPAGRRFGSRQHQ